MEQLQISKLVDLCVKCLETSHYTTLRVQQYQHYWKIGIVKYMKSLGIEIYSPSIGAEYIESILPKSEKKQCRVKEMIRSIGILDDVLQRGVIRLRHVELLTYPLEGAIGDEMKKWLNHLIQLRRSEQTIHIYRASLNNFLYYLNSIGILSVNEIEEKHILTFLASHPTCKTSILPTIKALLRFWKNEHIVDSRFDAMIDTYKIPKRERIPSFYTSEEVLKIENTISRSSGVGKRNYAMFLLASRLGLRAADIANLQFTDIDWDKNIIKLNMQKTKRIIELPLLAEVGNAIVDYLKNGRPQSNMSNVFLYSRAPYSVASSNVVTAAISSIISKSGINTETRHHGPHSLRHSLASAMLNNGSTIPIISESLGHRKTQTTMIYLKIDIESMRKCALPVPSVSEDFYTQRGGVFNG